VGRASSAKKVAKAAASGRRSRAVRERSLTFPAVIAVVVILGGLMIFAANKEQANADDTPPRAGIDHWHNAFGIYVCDAYLPDLTDQNDPVGIHTHADGVIHIHPFLSKAAGKNARMDDFFDATGLEASPSKVELPGIDGGAEYRPGHDCAGTPAGPIHMLRWDHPDDPEPEVITDDFGKVRLDDDGRMYAIVIAPEGTTVPIPPSTEKLQDLSLLDDYFPTEPNPGTTVPPEEDEGEGDGSSDTTDSTDSTDTTVAPEGGATDTTVAAADGSTTTVAPEASTTTSAP